MFKITTILNYNLQELENIVNEYSLTHHVVDIDILQNFRRPGLSNTSIPNGYIAVIKENIPLQEVSR